MCILKKSCRVITAPHGKRWMACATFTRLHWDAGYISVLDKPFIPVQSRFVPWSITSDIVVNAIDSIPLFHYSYYGNFPFLGKRFPCHATKGLIYSGGILLLIVFANAKMTEPTTSITGCSIIPWCHNNVFRITGLKGRYQTRMSKKTITIPRLLMLWCLVLQTTFLNTCSGKKCVYSS